MTHDLLFSVVKTLGLKITGVTITDIVENTYYSNLRITDADGGNPRTVDSRPSDAVAMAVRFGCPIYISERVFEKTQVLSKPITEDEVAKFKLDLKNLKPNDIIGQLLDGRVPPAAGRDEKNYEEDDTQEGEQDDEQT